MMMTLLIPAFSISIAFSVDITSFAGTSISPVSISIMSSALTANLILSDIASFLLNLYLPTLAKSYLLLSKNILLNSDSALSNVGGSPGLNFL